MNANSIIMKEINTNIIRNALRAEGKSTKQKLSELTGLSAVTVGSILQQLTSTNEVYEDDLVPSNGGRPAQRFCYNYEYSHALVLYAHEYSGRNKLYILVANLIGGSIHKEEINLQDLQEIHLHSFEPIIDRLIEQYPTIKAISFVLPGVEYNKIMNISDYNNLNGTYFTQHYRTRYGIPVAFENDVNAAIIGYCSQHTIESVAAAVYIYFPQSYPPGAGIYINGSIYRGFSNFAGEIKSMPIGVDWANVDYEDCENSCNIISKLIIAIISLLNPERIVLYGHFLSKEHLRAITSNCEQALSEAFIPQILLSNNFDLDFEIGAIECALDLLKPKLSLSE